jgi:PAS domain S-box-containing protein
MHVLGKRLLFLLLIYFTYNSLIYGQGGSFQLRGRIYNKSNQTLGKVKFQVFEGVKSIDTYTTSENGFYTIHLELNKIFTLEISKSGYAIKRIAINTVVPDDKKNAFYDEFTLIFLDTDADADLQTKSGLPSIKYTFNVAENKFVAEETGKKTNTNPQGNNNITKLQVELDNCTKLYSQQKMMLKEAEKIITDANNIRSRAVKYSDSLIRDANNKAILILRTSKKDTGTVVSSLDKNVKDISTDEYKKLSINEHEFLNKKNIRELHQKILRQSKQGKLTEKDSLSLKTDRLKMRQELFSMAEFQLELDRLHARTKEDSMRIEERESQLFLMKQDIELAEKELENAKNTLKLKDLEIQNKNTLLYSFVIGSVLLLVLLGFIYYNYRDKKRINTILEFQNQELEKLSIVASETSNAVVITDEQCNYNWVNKGYTRLYGYEIGEVTAENQKCLIGGSNSDEINSMIEKAKTYGEPVNYEFEALTKNGDKIWVQTNLTPIRNKQGQVTKIIAIDSDISAIKEAEFEILKQSRLLKRQNDQIMDSINYAKRIQDAMLPSEDLIKTYFPDSFIYFRPRDIVSGDFYWFSVQENKLFVAIVDCTGHGVPGAFMSLIGNSLLNHIVNEKKIFNPASILTELNNGVNLALSQKKHGDEVREDGMDLTLCCFDKSKKEVQIACANHTAIIITKGKIHEFIGDEISIGESYSKVENLQFTNHSFPFKDHSVMYLFSDGYQDQIGGPKNKKFLVGNFISFLTSNQYEDMTLQFDKLDEKFKEWKGENKQTDDVLVMGLKLNMKI